MSEPCELSQELLRCAYRRYSMIDEEVGGDHECGAGQAGEQAELAVSGRDGAGGVAVMSGNMGPVSSVP